MKKNRPPHPQLKPVGDEIFTPAGSCKKMAVPTAWQGLATMGSLGFTLVGCTFLGLFAGYYLDRWLKTSPWFTILLLLFGIAAGFLNIFVSATRSRPPRRPEEDAPQIGTDRNG
ncbi:MAG: AtpZ/AtpI family protein [Verrucomicrobiota bacterium]